jgi:peptide/nickel transport system permease protein
MSELGVAQTPVVGEPPIAAGFAAIRRERPPVAVILAMVFVAVLVIWAVLGGIIAPHDPDAENLATGVTGMSGAHWFGTDDIGRDIFSRAIAGTWSSVSGPLVLAFGQLAIGGALGMMAGYLGGWVDTAIARYVDVMWALPGLLVTIMVIGIVGGGYWGAVGALIALNAANDIRLFRAAALEQRGLPYVEAARTLGLRRRRIVARHLTPNLMPLFVTSFMLDFAGALTTLAGLAFLGFGLAPGTANWGTMIGENRDILLTNAWACLLPTALVVLTAVSMDLLGNWAYARLAERGKSR